MCWNARIFRAAGNFVRAFNVHRGHCKCCGVNRTSESLLAPRAPPTCTELGVYRNRPSSLLRALALLVRTTNALEGADL